MDHDQQTGASATDPSTSRNQLGQWITINKQEQQQVRPRIDFDTNLKNHISGKNIIFIHLNPCKSVHGDIQQEKRKD